MKIDGEASHLKTAADGGKIVITVPVTDLKTGIGLRDRHLKRDLDIGPYPDATLVGGAQQADVAGEQPGRDRVGATGRFHAARRDQTAQVQLPALADRQRLSRAGSGATIDIRDYGVEVPCYLGVCVEPMSS